MSKTHLKQISFASMDTRILKKKKRTQSNELYPNDWERMSVSDKKDLGHFFYCGAKFI